MAIIDHRAIEETLKQILIRIQSRFVFREFVFGYPVCLDKIGINPAQRQRSATGVGCIALLGSVRLIQCLYVIPSPIAMSAKLNEI
ncbi:MAG: hypothetical protein LBK99_16900 [Opitutaceae bacterium]|nr:hypothetical protein [Opitutaceae bacterium]